MFRLAHLSDPHIGPLPRPSLSELAGKRATGYLNWLAGRANHHRMDVLDALVRDIAATGPDHVAITGDLINLGLPAEIGPARSFLERLGPPDRVTLVPGNHDAYHLATIAEMYRAWSLWMEGDDAQSEDRRYAFPALRIRGPVAIVGLNSGIPTPPFMATGFLGKRQVEALGDLLADAGRQGLARLVLIHHPPFDIGAQKRLTDHSAVADTIARTGAEAVLHGHTHKGTTRMMAGAAGPIPVIGVPSASAATGGRHEAAAWNLITVSGEPGAWQVDVDRRGPSHPSSGSPSKG
jgi:3',5'-cyclic AMP phosphodiesterase CpdA